MASFVSQILLSASLASLSKTPSVVKHVPWFNGKLILYNASSTVEVDFYAGLQIIVTDCSGNVCPDHSLEWSAVSCDNYFEPCSDCVSSADSTSTTVLIGFITQFLQMSGNVQRSTGNLTA